MHTQGQSVQQPASLPISIVVRSSAPPAHAKAPLSMRKSSVEKRRRVRPEIFPAIPGFFYFGKNSRLQPELTGFAAAERGCPRVSAGVRGCPRVSYREPRADRPYTV